jgi:hypothetical protein
MDGGTAHFRGAHPGSGDVRNDTTVPGRLALTYVLLHGPSRIFFGKRVRDAEARQELQAGDQEAAAKSQSR